MFKRIVVGAVLIALLAGVFVLDGHLEDRGAPAVAVVAGDDAVVLRGLPLAVLVMLLAAAGYLEFARLAAGAGVGVPRFTGMVAAMAVATWPFARQMVGHAGEAGMVVVAMSVMAVFAAQFRRHRNERAILRVGATLLGVCYVGVCGAVVLSIRMDFGIRAFVLFLAAVKCTDIGAYFAGTAVGRHKMIPWLSPGKSWEGLAGGLVAAAGVSVALAAAMDPVFGPAGGRIPLPAAAVFGAVVGAFGQAGDLCESAMKRDAGLKDSGGSVPAFGGVLDVMDSPLLSAPAAYVLLAIFR